MTGVWTVIEFCKQLHSAASYGLACADDVASNMDHGNWGYQPCSHMVEGRSAGVSNRVGSLN